MAPRRDIETLFSVNTEDFIRPFAVPALGLRGRTVRLGPLVDAVLDRHAYPVPVARLIAEALALTALLGSSLKFDGRFVIQSQSDGPVSFLVADYFGDGDLRAYCRFDAERVAAIHGEGRLLGTGHLAFTVDQGEGMKSYQGIVPLEGHTLADTAETYFRQSEQIPTRIALAAGEILQPGTDGAGSVKGWRAGGLFVQQRVKSYVDVVDSPAVLDPVIQDLGLEK